MLKKLSFKFIITISVFVVFLILLIVISFLFNDFYLKTIRNKYIEDNLNAVSKSRITLDKEKQALESKLYDMTLTEGRMFLYEILKNKKYILFMNNGIIEKEIHNTADYYYALSSIIRMNFGDKTSQLSARKVKLFNSNYETIADSERVIPQKTSKEELNILNKYYSKNNFIVSFCISYYYFINEKLYFEGISNVGVNENFRLGTLLLRTEVDQNYLRELKSSYNKEIIIVVNNKIVSSTLENTKNLKISTINENNGYEIKINNKKMMFHFQPLLGYEDKSIGYIGTGIYMDKVEKEYFEVMRKLIFFEVIFSLMLLLILVRLVRYLFKPFDTILHTIKTIGDGDYSQNKEIQTGKELVILMKGINDLSEKIAKRESDLADKNRRLLEVDRLKDDFLANTSHELRTPINGIIGLSDSLLDGIGGELSEKMAKNLNLIIMSGKRLLTLINDILDFSKLKNSELNINKTNVDIGSVTEIVVEILKPLCKKKKIEINNNIPRNFKFVLGDENRIQQIMYNLVGNAVKFTENGKVEIEAEVKEKFAMIKVKDTGIGIAKEHFNQIFESFEQIESSASRTHGGTGIGLSITKKLIELHGGEIYVESDVGKGSTFTFTVPLFNGNIKSEIKIQPYKIEKIKIEEVDESVKTEKKKYKVLVVDDEIVNLQVIIDYLAMQDIDVETAINGEECIRKINNNKYDIVILDVMMPRMSGFDVCKKLRETYLPTDLPIILLTAKTQAQDIAEGFDTGANDYLTKPVYKSELIKRIKSHINISKISNAYSRFVPHEFLKLLNRETIVDVQLGDQILKEMVVMFSDIRGFTSLSEKMTPQENFNFINAFLKEIGPLVRKNRGIIDKYIGDAIMALFPESVEDSLDAAIEMQKTVIKFNEIKNGNNHISIGIGLHIGKLMLGTIGEESRMESTVIADSVNLASRLEGLTKKFGAGIIVSSSILENIKNKENYTFRTLDILTVDGKSEPVSIFEILDGLPDDEYNLKKSYNYNFEAGVETLREKKYFQAQNIFREILEKNKNDKAAVLFLERSIKENR